MSERRFSTFREILTKPQFGEDRGLNASHSISDAFTYIGLGLAGTAAILAPIYFLRTHDFGNSTAPTSAVKTEQMAPAPD